MGVLKEADKLKKVRGNLTRLCVWLTILCFVVAVPPAMVAEPAVAVEQPAIMAEVGLLMDLQSGQILYAKDIDKQMYPASTTKILTCIIAMEESEPQELVTVSHRASGAEGSAIGLQVDEQLKMGDLLYALMLSSANDAALAIAEHVAGSVEEFAVLMNQKARSVGALNSNFVNPNGLPDPEHYTTAGDLALIGRYAMQNKEFRGLVNTTNHEIERGVPEEMKPQTWLWNHNQILYRYTGALGVKTGYTVQAGQCLVAAAGREGWEMLAVVMKCDGNSHYSDAAALLDHGFNNFMTRRLVKEGQLVGGVDVPGGTSQVGLITTSAFHYSFPVDGEPEVKQSIVTNEDLKAPVEQGEQMGYLVITADGRELGQVDLVAAHTVERKPIFHWWYLLVGLLLVIALLRLRVLIRRRGRRNKKFQNFLIHEDTDNYMGTFLFVAPSLRLRGTRNRPLSQFLS